MQFIFINIYSWSLKYLLVSSKPFQPCQPPRVCVSAPLSQPPAASSFPKTPTAGRSNCVVRTLQRCKLSPVGCGSGSVARIRCSSVEFVARKFVENSLLEKFVARIRCSNSWKIQRILLYNHCDFATLFLFTVILQRCNRNHSEHNHSEQKQRCK